MLSIQMPQTRTLLWLGLALWPLLGLAQPIQPDAAHAWRRANDLVGQFKRGHADVLKWEQGLPRNAAQAPTSADALDLSTPEAAVARALQLRPKWAAPLNRLSMAERELVLAGHWTELDPRLSWRLEGLDEVVERLTQVRQAWWQAATSQLMLAPTHTALEAAQLAHELGQRMVAVGNWSALAQTPQELALAQAQINWQRARYAAAQDRTYLLKLLELAGQADTLRLPDALPPTAPTPMDAPEFERLLLRIQAELPTVRRAQHRAQTQLAYRAYLTSQAVAVAQGSIVQTRERITDETQARYNGMLKSTWELLGEVQNQAQARVALLAAQRDLALATQDLNWALFGEEPKPRGSSDAGAASTVAGAGAGH